MKNIFSKRFVEEFTSQKIINLPSLFVQKINFYLVGFLLISSLNFAQTGSTCLEAVPVLSSPTCNYSNFTTSGAEFWLKFTANSRTVNISLITTKFGIDAPHIHSIKLFEGTCSSLNMIADDELAFYDEAKELSIDLNASNLTIGQVYYIKAEREVSTHECTRTNCKLNGSTDASTFSLCIENITVVIPPDFNEEAPNSSLSLQTNRGQLLHDDGTVAEEVRLYNTTSNPAIFICKDHVSYVIKGINSGERAYKRIDIEYEGANSNYGVFKTEQVAGITNYYLPHIQDGVTGNKSYSRVVSNNIYPFIDMQHYSNKDGIKNYFVVRPGGDFSDIVLKFTGSTDISINSDNLVVNSELGAFEFEKPHIYYVNPAGNVVPMPFEINYQMLGSDKVKFEISGFPSPPSMTLVIQMDQGHSDAIPKSIDNLLWSTYYGSVEDEEFNDIDHDDAGNVYFTGWTWDLQFPHTNQTIVSPTSHNGRIILGSHKPLGERRWSTIYGAEADLAYGCATDNLGNVYVTGLTGVYSHPNQFIDIARAGAFNMPPLSSTVNATYATLLRFNQSNGSCTWSTLFGEHTSTAFFRGNCIATDINGNVYIGGEGKRIINSPLIHSGSQHFESTSGTKVGFLAKFNSSGALTWSTMFGNDNLSVREMNTGFNPQTNQSELFIVGTTSGNNTNLFTLASVDQVNDYQAGYQGGASDAFFAKFNSSDNLRWSSFFGGAGEDIGSGIDYDYAETSLFLTGQTKSNSTTFPLQTLSNPQVHYNGILNGASDGFLSVLKFIPETTGGHLLHYSSYFGGSSDDLCGKVQISGSGNAYVIGMSKSQNFPIRQLNGNYYQDVLENDPTGQHFDCFILGLNPSLSYGWGTYFGGEWYYNGSNVNAQSNDAGNGISVFNDQILYIGGTTNADLNFPVTVDLTASPNAYIQYENSGVPNDIPLGWSDGFLAQFEITDVLGLEELNSDETYGNLSVYPNPSNGNFSLVGSNLKLDGKITIEVINVIGQGIYSQRSNISNGEISETILLGNLSNGIYIVNINDGSKKITRRVLIK